MRCDQSCGLTKEAVAFLEAHEVQPDPCPCCHRTYPSPLEVIGHYNGFDEYALFRHKLQDGRYADEFLQSQPWSSGPVAFIGLRLSDGQEFLWTEEEINQAL
jgi:hypothetical protein